MLSMIPKITTIRRCEHLTMPCVLLLLICRRFVTAVGKVWLFGTADPHRELVPSVLPAGPSRSSGFCFLLFVRVFIIIIIFIFIFLTYVWLM